MKKYLIFSLIILASFISPRPLAAAISGADSQLVNYVNFDDGDIAGKIGNAKAFDGSTVVSINAPDANYIGPLTLSAWVSFSTGSRVHEIAIKGDAADFAGLPFNLYTTNDASPRLIFYRGSGSGCVSFRTNSGIAPGAWHHIAVTTSQGSISAPPTVYIDNVAIAVTNIGCAGDLSMLTPSGNNKAILIGRNADGSAAFHGQLDDFRIYSRALPALEIGELYAYTGDGTNNAPPPANTFSLAVTKGGTGSGTVTSSGGSLNCGSTCSTTGITSGTVSTLTASPASGSIFAGWSGGGCSGTGTCAVTITADTTVTATFIATTQPPPVNGVCSATLNTCTAGTFADQPDTSTNYVWQCTGSGTGATSPQCSTAIPVTQPPVVGATTYYVRAGASGNGSDWTNALGNIPATQVRGDTYYVADGSYPSQTFSTPTDATKLIVIKKATASDHGTDTGWNSTYGDGVAVFPSLNFTTSYYVFDGVTGGGYGSWNSGFGFEITTTGTRCSDLSLVTLSGNVSNITVKHSHIHGGNNNYPVQGVKGTTGSVSNSTFANNSIHTLFGAALHFNNWSNSIFENNHIANVRSTGAVDAYCPHWHAEAVSSIGTNDSLTFKNNIWDRIDGTAVFAGVNRGTSNNWKIYGNIFSRSVTVVYYFNEPSPSTNQQVMNNLEFYNNTIVNAPTVSQGGVVINSGTNNRVYNNIWYNNISNVFTLSGTHDYNYFSENRRVEGCSPACDKDAEGIAGETNGQNGSGNPFVNPTLDPLVGDFRLKAPVNAGVALAGTFATDPTGQTRGSDGVWDRGAYEFSGSQSSPNGICSTVVNRCLGGTYVTLPDSSTEALWQCSGGTSPTCRLPIATAYKEGDFNKDGWVNTIDYSDLSGAWNTTNALYDLNKDGRVNTIDYSMFARDWTPLGQ